MEYLNLVSQIVAAEQNAQEIAREAKERERTMEADLEQEIAALRASCLERAKRRIAEVERTETEAAREALARWDQKLSAAMASVEDAYAQNGAAWTEALFQRIVGGQA